MTEAAARWVVTGRVQGVGFRWFGAKHARRLGLVGWATNLPDGRVEVVARGGPSELAEFERLLGRGPALAHVESVEKTDIPHHGVTGNTFKTG